jgi:hypothetical protein
MRGSMMVRVNIAANALGRSCRRGLLPTKQMPTFVVRKPINLAYKLAYFIICSTPRGFPKLSRGSTGIDGQNRAGDVAGLVAEQILDGVCHIFHLGKPAQRATSYDLLSLLLDKSMCHFGR